MNIDSFVAKTNALLTPKRMKYPYIIGACLWIGWIISIIAGKGNTDLAGNLIGTDFSAFYAAGKIVLMGKGAELYNLDLAYSIQQSLTPIQNIGFYPFLNPPQYALLMVPFALMPYPWAPIIWILLGLLSLYISLRLLDNKNANRWFILSLTLLPVFCVASFGQNSFLSLFIFCLTYKLWGRNRFFLSGMVYSLLLYKPQFLIALIIVWVLQKRKSWKQVWGFLVGLLLQLGMILIFLPEAGLVYPQYFSTIVTNLSELNGFPIWHAFSIDAFWSALLPELFWLSRILYFLCAAVCTYFYFKISLKYRDNLPISCALALIWLILISPYLMIYDWTLLLFPAIMLWMNSSSYQTLWRTMFAAIWSTSFLSGAITYLQLKFLPIAVQISIPVLISTFIFTYKYLLRGNDKMLS